MYLHKKFTRFTLFISKTAQKVQVIVKSLYNFLGKE